ncbi:helix-turn-helix domain-containing protein [Acinetobacter larvae]|uniref:Helix-turn-helix domain-containing protein n=1 Tax=Acinetobacter larvae TaxID=1789224 RepID=A0A1B2LZ95_9GAMM|nr:helix-turn-helix domain-containing protein [Acinetobacter larvae]AOA58256.1 helix-turn-helix domain-containing protein [Acinetobacter larvae]
MSLDATNWAWRVQLQQKKGGSSKPLKKLLLLSLADRAGEDHCCYPSVGRLVEDTEMDRKTVLKIIDELIEDGLILDTGERKGRTKQVKVYRLMGVNGRETVPTLVHLDTKNNELKSPNNGTVPTMEPSQQSDERVPTFRGKSPNVGTRNLLKNLSDESKNKKDWLCFKKLENEIREADGSIDFAVIAKSTWAGREKRAFEIYNAEKNLCDDLMNFYFADWLINAYRSKYSDSAKSQGSKFSTAAKANQLSEKQIHVFATKLAHHPEFAGRYSEPGDSYEKLAAKIAVKLEDPAQAKKWEGYLKQVGFTGVLEGSA